MKRHMLRQKKRCTVFALQGYWLEEALHLTPNTGLEGNESAIR